MLTQFLTLLCLVLLTSLAIFGWHYATLYDSQGIKQTPSGGTYDIGAENGEILWWIPYYFKKLTAHIPVLQYLHKPMFGCLICMAGPYGTISYWTYTLTTKQHITLLTFILWVVLIVAVAGLNRIIKTFASKQL